MTTLNQFIEIPVHKFTLDPLNRALVSKLIRLVDARFILAAKDWEDGNNSGDSDSLRKKEDSCDRLRGEAEAMLAPLGIKVSYPGLYPLFEVNGFDEHTTKAAVLAAIGHPRNWLES